MHTSDSLKTDFGHGGDFAKHYLFPFPPKLGIASRTIYSLPESAKKMAGKKTKTLQNDVKIKGGKNTHIS